MPTITGKNEAPNVDFDLIIDRTHSHSEKYAGRQRMFGRADLIPLWVADMDFACPASITQALMGARNIPSMVTPNTPRR